MLQRGENTKPYDLEEAGEISKIIYGMYVKHDINVIRIGDFSLQRKINYEKRNS